MPSSTHKHIYAHTRRFTPIHTQAHVLPTALTRTRTPKKGEEGVTLRMCFAVDVLKTRYDSVGSYFFLSLCLNETTGKVLLLFFFFLSRASLSLLPPPPSLLRYYPSYLKVVLITHDTFSHRGRNIRKKQ